MATASDLGRKATHVREQLVTMLSRAKIFITEAPEHPLESARVVIAKTESTVRKYPLVSLGLVFGTGLCLGALLTRKSRG